jgi:hypothetical protein
VRVGKASAIRASSGDARPFAVTSPPANHRSDLARDAPSTWHEILHTGES